MRRAAAIRCSTVMWRLATRSFSRELVELDIDTDQVAALARNDEDAAFVGRLDQRLEADIGEVGDGEHVHHAPGLIGRVAAKRPTDRLAHGAARAVAADDIAGPDRFDLALMPGIEALEPDGHRVGMAPPGRRVDARSSRRRA